MSKNVPNTNEASTNESTLLLNNTSGLGKAKKQTAEETVI